MPIEHVTGWLFRVARNRIIDLFRQSPASRLFEDLDGEEKPGLEEILPSPEGGPDHVYIRRLVLEELESALDELPPEQRDVFIRHEIDGESFNEIAAATGVKLNTLLSRKRYAVLHLRARLQDFYDELTKA
jgi:RNA polymerase sigma factor (sigma-70 family)